MKKKKKVLFLVDINKIYFREKKSIKISNIHLVRMTHCLCFKKNIETQALSSANILLETTVQYLILLIGKKYP